MARAFTSADVVQHNAGIATGATDPGVSVPAATSEGYGGVIVMGAGTLLDTPEQWHMAARAGGSDLSSLLGIMCRADLPGGETGWPFASSGGGATQWCWLAEEWANLSYAPVWTNARTNQTTSPASISTGTTGSVDSAYYVAVAAMLLIGSAAAPSGWPSSVSWSNGFTETDVQTISTGQTTTSLQLRVARKYETSLSAGPWETTATFDVTQTSKIAYACLAVFRAEDQIETPAAAVMTS